MTLLRIHSESNNSILLIFSFNQNLNVTISGVDLSTREIAAVEEQRINLTAADLSPLSESNQDVVKSAFMNSYVFGFRTIAWAATAMALAAAVSSLMMITGRRKE